MYTRLCKGLNDRGILVKTERLNDYITDRTKDWYGSVFQYSDEHHKQFLESKTVAGITDVMTNKLVFDFDSKDDLDLAKKDCIELIQRMKKEGFKEEWIGVYFSGCKGFTVESRTNLSFTPNELKEICLNRFGKGLQTLDTSLYNASRILRLVDTKHQVSGLYKIPVRVKDILNNISIERIKEMAIDYEKVDSDSKMNAFLDKSFIPKVEEKKTLAIKALDTKFLDYTIKPKYLTNCRWALQNGYFNDGHRNNALLCLSATYKNQGYASEITYRMLKGVAELQARVYNSTRFSDEEIYNNIILQVYSNTWKGGQFTCREFGWLQNYCQSLGTNACRHTSNELTIKVDDVYALFEEYTEKYEDNILQTGIQSLDKKCKFMVGTSNALIAPPGVGKTSTALQLINHNSLQNVPNILFSYDMFHAALYMRILQRHTGYSQDVLYDIFKHDKKKAGEFKQLLKDNYKNTEFCFKSGQTIDEIIETIHLTQDKSGQKVKLIVVDYNELVITNNVSDMTASSAMVAQKLRQVANEEEVCVVSLLQPSKVYSNPGDVITSHNSAKGSSSIVQSLTLMLGCSRPGFSPVQPERDKFFNITCLKNRNGALFSLDFKWHGLTGSIDELDESDRIELEEIRSENEENRREERGRFGR